jgi:hypothetical protein
MGALHGRTMTGRVHGPNAEAESADEAGWDLLKRPRTFPPHLPLERTPHGVAARRLAFKATL